MDITVYLPDELGERAKAADLPFSRLLRSAVEAELVRRAAAQQTLEGSILYEITLEDREGRTYTGRLEGKCLVDTHGVAVFLTNDERVLVHDEGKLDVHEIAHPEEELRAWLDQEEYVEAIHALGLRPVVEL